jgi:hypothetical protein
VGERQPRWGHDGESESHSWIVEGFGDLAHIRETILRVEGEAAGDGGVPSGVEVRYKRARWDSGLLQALGGFGEGISSAKGRWPVTISNMTKPSE